ncbi:hypothetical protein WMY93_005276 [Mugilogobius chulae]|uniref:threonine--tRNA ligase n=1 Tax=Mugilogobius chulae TaxID=88201 RepID=A0AAW0PWS3_9GOBI
MAEEAVINKMSEMQVNDGKKGGAESKKKTKGASGDTAGRAELKAEHDAIIAERASKESKPIKVTLPDGKVVDAESWKTTPYQIACSISQGLADNTVIAKVNNAVWDLDRPLEDDCSLQLLKFDDEEAQAKIIKEKQPFERLEIKKETLLEMFKYNKFKCRILNEKVTTPTTTVYR